MNEIGKFLANDLEIWFNRRLVSLQSTDKRLWDLTLEITHETAIEKPQMLQSRAVVLAIPAPQLATILDPLIPRILPEFYTILNSIQYDPCITVMASYPAEKQTKLTFRNPDWKAIRFPQNPIVDWVGLDSSKRSNSQFPVFVIQSKAEFAQQFLDDSDLQPATQLLLLQVASLLDPWLAEPEWTQTHRWRYAFCQNPIPQSYLETLDPLPLVGIGDWCGSDSIVGSIERTLKSGTAASAWLISRLSGL